MVVDFNMGRNQDVENDETLQATFGDLGVREELQRAAEEMGFHHPSPVQLAAVPAGLVGTDLIVQAKSGTGKTVAFGCIFLETFAEVCWERNQIASAPLAPEGSSDREEEEQVEVDDAPIGLLLCPTREIALQGEDELRRLGWHLKPRPNILCATGGVPIHIHADALAKGKGKDAIDIVVGTPGRVHALFQAGHLRKKNLRIVSLDEADKLLDDGFFEVTNEILGRCYSPEVQYLAFSATFQPHLVQKFETIIGQYDGAYRAKLAKKAAKCGNASEEPSFRPLPEKIFLCSSAIKKFDDGTTDLQESAVLRGVKHYRYLLSDVDEDENVSLRKRKLPALVDVFSAVPFQQAFVFCNHPQTAVQVAGLLSNSGVPAVATSGKMEQSWRCEAFTGMKTHQYRVMVCSDLLARGVDCQAVDIVINLDVPVDKETYLHRSGRTARFGGEGICVNIVSESEAMDLAYFQAQLDLKIMEWTGEIDNNEEEVIQIPEELAEQTAYELEQKVATDRLRMHQTEHILQEEEEIFEREEEQVPLTLEQIKARALQLADTVASQPPLPEISKSNSEASLLPKINQVSQTTSREEDRYNNWQKQKKTQPQNLESQVGQWEDVDPQFSVFNNKQEKVKLINLSDELEDHFESQEAEFEEEEDQESSESENQPQNFPYMMPNMFQMPYTMPNMMPYGYQQNNLTPETKLALEQMVAFHNRIWCRE